MNRLIVLTLSMILIATSWAAETVVSDFEDLSLDPESFYNGSDGAGGFTSGSAEFMNDYSADFDSWEGFAYANQTDTTTPGFGNQYSAITGAGVSGSSVYAIGFMGFMGNRPTVVFPEEVTVGEAYFTNTTYAYLSMRDGDPFAKKFGGDTGDDPDWFLLTVIGKDSQGEVTGTVEFYLADYRFDDNANDFLVDAWTRVDLSSLGEVASLEFELSSSDVGAFGMNTPAYFALDNLALGVLDAREKIIKKYYNDILDRDPDAGGAEAWKSESERLVSLGIDVKEGFIALAKFFFNSAEYLLQSKDDAQYVTDLYQTCFNRTPRQDEVDAWVDFLSQGVSRNVLLNYFVFGDEYELYMNAIFGEDASLPEAALLNDFYRGLQGRMPDSPGFNAWLELIENAKPNGEQAVRELLHQIAQAFLHSEEYGLRNKSDDEFLEDLYNGILRRGAQRSEFDGWRGFMNAGMTREEVLEDFINSPEFQPRIQAVIAPN
ncbi:MAG: DUF4465 domain-containing protein [Desulfobacterales bacterium]|nr:MAG: DUF4465 domain-containing protein [Desulfobacterales bacterium]